mmetsp:Transcript_18718/g.28146  ORF Transcript_18718/g.28146 Transcript_18718/m.28146 type:complete len:236 (+) Transcript_18718:159-866(+)
MEDQHRRQSGTCPRTLGGCGMAFRINTTRRKRGAASGSRSLTRPQTSAPEDAQPGQSHVAHGHTVPQARKRRSAAVATTGASRATADPACAEEDLSTSACFERISGFPSMSTRPPPAEEQSTLIATLVREPKAPWAFSCMKSTKAFKSAGSMQSTGRQLAPWTFVEEDILRPCCSSTELMSAATVQSVPFKSEQEDSFCSAPSPKVCRADLPSKSCVSHLFDIIFVKFFNSVSGT